MQNFEIRNNKDWNIEKSIDLMTSSKIFMKLSKIKGYEYLDVDLNFAVLENGLKIKDEKKVELVLNLNKKTDVLVFRDKAIFDVANEKGETQTFGFFEDKLASGPQHFFEDKKRQIQDKIDQSPSPVKEVLQWLETGDKGSSSYALCKNFYPEIEHFRLKGKSEFKAHPSDPADLRRCVEFLDAVPGAKNKLEQMKAVSPQWDNLVNNWSELTQLFAEERASNAKTGKAPKTYEKMKELINIENPALSKKIKI